MTGSVLIANDEASASPNEYRLPPNLAFIPTAVTALFDGSLALDPYLACLTFKSQSGQIIARSFPEVEIAAGTSVEVSYQPF